ncbi:MAG: dynein regulation protein LC7 [Nonomuraea sp.]|nr:dynein regulation protein LC7 [Nonomuraea sp.]
MDHEPLLAELRLLQDRVVGITDVAVATADGLIIAADHDESIDRERLAAMAATTLGLARGSGEALGRGVLQQSVSRFSGGFVVVQPVGELALLAVLGDPGLDVARLHLESQVVADRINRLLTSPETAIAS